MLISVTVQGLIIKQIGNVFIVDFNTVSVTFNSRSNVHPNFVIWATVDEFMLFIISNENYLNIKNKPYVFRTRSKNPDNFPDLFIYTLNVRRPIVLFRLYSLNIVSKTYYYTVHLCSCKG